MTRAASACCPAAGSPSRTPTPTPSSPASRWTPTTSTPAPGRTRAEELAFLARPGGRHRPGDRRRSPTASWRRRRRCCWSASSRRRSRRSSSCGCARPPQAGRGVRGRCPSSTSAPFATAARRRSCCAPRVARPTPARAPRRSPLRALADGRPGAVAASRGRCALPGAVVILVGERLAEVPGALTALGRAGPRHRRPARLGAAAGRRARRGRRRRAAHPAARRPQRRRRRRPRRGRRALGRRCVPAHAGPGRRPASSPPPPTASSAALLVGGVDPDDLPDPRCAEAALDRRRLRGQPGDVPGRSVTEYADVVLPVAAAAEKAGTLPRLGGPAPPVRRRRCTAPARCPTAGCCTRSPTRWTSTSRLPTVEAARAELAALGTTRRPAEGRTRRSRPAGRARPSAADEAVLATWRQLLDLGSLQAGEPRPGRHRPAAGRAWSSPATAAELGRGRRRPKLTVADRARRGHAAGAGHRRCPTGWSGCRRTRRAATVRTRPRRRPRCRRGDQRRSRLMDLLAARDQPTLADFGTDPFWLDRCYQGRRGLRRSWSS